MLVAAIWVTASPVSATTTSGCTVGMYPVAEASTSNLRVGCVIAPADGGDAVRITDFENVNWHDGASRWVTANITSGSTVANVVSVATNHINIAGTFSTGSFGTQSGDENRVVEAGYNKGLQPGSFIVDETGTGGGGTITLNQPANKTASNLKFMIENGPGRGVNDAVLNGTTTLTSATANFVDGSPANHITSDVGKSISGTGIPLGTTISAVNSATNVTLSQAATVSATGVGIGIAGTTRNSTHRMVNDLTVSGNAIVSAMANFEKTDIGLPVKGTGLPANAYITNVTDGAHATISASASTPAADIVAVIGNASATAPVKDGVDPVLSIQTELALDPANVAGSPDCSLDIVSGADIEGYWNSPAKFAIKRAATDPIFYFNDIHIGLSNPAERAQTMLASGPFIGQILFKTSVVDFAAYVQQTPADSAVIVFPFLPTTLGECTNPSYPLASVWSFNGDILSQASAPSGYGRSGFGSFRSTVPLDAAGDPAPGTASYENLDASTTDLSSVALNATSDTLTKSGNGLVDGQVVTITCQPNCVAEGLKENIAYYAHVTGANTFQLDLKPFDVTNGVPFVHVDIKSSSFTVGVHYNTFTSVYAAPASSCTIVRPTPLPNYAGAFPCSAG
jgi:hypothetical protein